MTMKCSYATNIDNDVIICQKYGDYCLLDYPDQKKCDELYGNDEDYNLQEAEYEEDDIDDNDILDE